MLPKRQIKNPATPKEIATTNRNAKMIGNALLTIGLGGYGGSVLSIIRQNKLFIKNLRKNIKKTHDPKGIPEMNYADPRIKLRGDVLVRKGKINVYRGEGTPTWQDRATLLNTREFIRKGGPKPIMKKNKLSGKWDPIYHYRPQIAADMMSRKIQISQLVRYAATDPRRGTMYARMKRGGGLTAAAESQYDAIRKTYRIKLSDYIKGMDAKKRTINFINKSYKKNRADEIRRSRGRLVVRPPIRDILTGKVEHSGLIHRTQINRTKGDKKVFNVVQGIQEAPTTKLGNPGVYELAPRNPFTGLQNLKKGYILKNIDKQFLIPKKLNRKLKK